MALLTDGAIEVPPTAGSEQQKATCLDPRISGKWAGTMNLSEPQAGSDLAAMRATPQGDGSFKLFGTKIFITYGEHDMAENIVHLVLARTPDAPAGVKRISPFIVPKFLVSTGGFLGARNDVHCVSIEHKFGIKAVFSGSVLYLKLAEIVPGGWKMARTAAIAQQKLDVGAGDT